MDQVHRGTLKGELDALRQVSQISLFTGAPIYVAQDGRRSWAGVLNCADALGVRAFGLCPLARPVAGNRHPSTDVENQIVSRAPVGVQRCQQMSKDVKMSIESIQP